MGIIQNYKFDPYKIITILPNGNNFIIDYKLALEKYSKAIYDFVGLVKQSSTSAELLEQIRSISIDKDTRMSYLKLFRRLVCSSLDTELSKKIKKVSTDEIVENFGDFFLDIQLLKDFLEKDFNHEHLLSLACLLAEYDKRGESGYQLTDLFFNEITKLYPHFQILGPQRAGSDIELNTIYPNFQGGNFPCDFVIIEKMTQQIRAVGFCRYDSTRGGAQSDDRTSGNSQKVSQIKNHFNRTKEVIKLLFVSDGPGMAHNDTWEETLRLDISWEDNVRVTSLKIVNEVTKGWL